MDLKDISKWSNWLIPGKKEAQVTNHSVKHYLWIEMEDHVAAVVWEVEWSFTNWNFSILIPVAGSQHVEEALCKTLNRKSLLRVVQSVCESVCMSLSSEVKVAPLIVKSTTSSTISASLSPV